MRWAIGLGLRGHSVGAVEFGRWVRARPGGEADEFEVVHTVSDLDVVPLAHRAIEEVLSERDLTGPQIHAHVNELGDPVAALADSCAAVDADAVFVGRRALKDGRGWPRLGRIGRRLLRSHPGPVVVVPPDWVAADAGSGPLVATTDLGPDSAAALRFASGLCEALQRPWVAVHVLTPPAAFTLYGLSGQPDELETRRARAQQAASAQLAKLDLKPDEIRIVHGLVVDAVLQLRSELDAPLLVTGSRRLSALGRLFSASVGTELAAASASPVAVVPPDVGEHARD